MFVSLREPDKSGSSHIVVPSDVVSDQLRAGGAGNRRMFWVMKWSRNDSKISGTRSSAS